MVGIQFKPNVKITKRAKVVKFKISQKDLAMVYINENYMNYKIQTNK